ncbi:MAG: PilZ domain-containing protein [Candidatus Aureabacteria bacterium]|nr:PilZ domain-containing protein [Candidatus Auribacterota bacterium]
MILKRIFKKKNRTTRPHREKTQLSVKYELSFVDEGYVEFDSLSPRAIIEDINKKGIKLTVTPIFDKNLFKKIRRHRAFIFIELSLPPDNVTFQVKGLLRWANNDTSKFPSVTEIGVEFTDMSPEEKVMISRFVSLKGKKR